MCAGLSPPLCTQPLHYGGEGERYKGPQEMLLQTNQYVLLCDVMRHAAWPFEPFLGSWRQLCSWKSPHCLRLARPGGCSSAPAWVCSGDAGPRRQPAWPSSPTQPASSIRRTIEFLAKSAHTSTQLDTTHPEAASGWVGMNTYT